MNNDDFSWGLKVQNLTALIERLAPPNGVWSECQGIDRCAWCWEGGDASETELKTVPHRDDCPWVEARKLIEATR